MSAWNAADYLIGSSLSADGMLRVHGYVHLGLGLHMDTPPQPAKGRRRARPAIWHLTHLETGHLVHRLSGDVMTVFPVATEIAECADWSFTSLHGWKDRDPELPNRLLAFASKHKKVILPRLGGAPNEDTAREISYARA